MTPGEPLPPDDRAGPPRAPASADAAASPPPPAPLTGATVWTLAAATGVAVANLYYNQPLLAQMARSFGVRAGAAGFIPTLTQAGYALGLLLFVPLGDRLERRRLITIMLLASTLALAAAALAPSLALLALASLAVGAATIAPQLILPLAAGLAAPGERGRVVGTIMGGLLVGILLARTVSGFVGAAWGWRTMYWIAGGLMVALAGALWRVLPPGRGESALRYPALLRSLVDLARREPVLREAALVGALAFGSFSAFWSTLVFRLGAPPYAYGARVAGLFGLVGVVGALAAPLVGRASDVRSPRLAVTIGLGASLGAWTAFAFLGAHLGGLIAGVILLDFGTQAAQVANQTRVYALRPEARSRMNTVYMVSYFVGGAAGSILGATAWAHWRWPGVCGVGALLVLAALAVFLGGRGRRRTRAARGRGGGAT